MMSKRVAMSVAWALGVVCVVFTLLGLALEAVNRSTAQSATFIYANTLALALCFPLVGMIIAIRQPKNAIGWLFCTIGLSAAIPMLAIPYAIYTLRVNPGALPGGALMTWLGSWIWLPGVLLIPLLLLLFPNGRLLSPRWHWAVWAVALGATLVTLEVAWFTWQLRGATLLPYLERGTDIEIGGGVTSQILSIIEFPLLLGGFTASIVAIALRLRRSQGVERHQLKWFTYATALAALAQLVIMLATYTEIGGDSLDLALIALNAISIVGIALAVAIAILRYRLYDIDIIIRRTLVYGTLTASLALVYVGSVVLLQQVFTRLTGSSELAIVASTLAIAALFNPLRKRIQHVIDKRFYRRKYDAAKVLAAFGASVRDETDLERLTAEVLHVVDETVQPAFVGLWLREPGSDKQRGSL